MNAKVTKNLKEDFTFTIFAYIFLFSLSHKPIILYFLYIFQHIRNLYKNNKSACVFKYQSARLLISPLICQSMTKENPSDVQQVR